MKQPGSHRALGAVYCVSIVGPEFLAVISVVALGLALLDLRRPQRGYFGLPFPLTFGFERRNVRGPIGHGHQRKGQQKGYGKPC